MAKYDVVSPINHNGKRYEPGEKIDLSPVEAETLIKCGAVAGKNEAPAEPQS